MTERERELLFSFLLKCRYLGAFYVGMRTTEDYKFFLILRGCWSVIVDESLRLTGGFSSGLPVCASKQGKVIRLGVYV